MFKSLFAKKVLAIVAGTSLIAAAESACATEKTVTVSSKTMPWDTSANPKFDYGRHDGNAPKIVFGIPFRVNKTINIQATGLTSTAGSGPPNMDANGQIGYEINDRAGASGRVLPSFYIDKSQYPVQVNALVGCFVSADGVMVGRPFKIGSAATIEVPQGAVALSLGINDDIFSDNLGSLKVTITFKVPTISVSDEPSPN